MGVASFLMPDTTVVSQHTYLASLSFLKQMEDQRLGAILLRSHAISLLFLGMPPAQLPFLMLSLFSTAALTHQPCPSPGPTWSSLGSTYLSSPTAAPGSACGGSLLIYLIWDQLLKQTVTVPLWGPGALVLPLPFLQAH